MELEVGRVIDEFIGSPRFKRKMKNLRFKYKLKISPSSDLN